MFVHVIATHNFVINYVKRHSIFEYLVTPNFPLLVQNSFEGRHVWICVDHKKNWNSPRLFYKIWDNKTNHTSISTTSNSQNEVEIRQHILEIRNLASRILINFLHSIYGSHH